MNEIHEVVLTHIEIDEDHNDWFICRACGFAGILLAAIKHVVANQFRVAK